MPLIRDDRPYVIPGVEALLESQWSAVAGCRVGLVTNPSGVDRRRVPTIDRLAAHPKIRLAALFGPEHGVRGEAQAGEHVPYAEDAATGLPVFSLYGQDAVPESEGDRTMDERMREYDTRDAGKAPLPEMLEGLDALIFDLQDIGTRVYTYTATMALCMDACARYGLRFLVLDRPNPINGLDMEGPILRYPEYSSFVGRYPIPLRHGMTMGELARMFNDRFLEKKADLTVIPMEGWRRKMWFEDTALPWIRPSPNIPGPVTAVVYPGQVAWEGTNVSEGRGTERPFEVCGAPWIDGRLLAERLNGLRLPGIVFEAFRFTPVLSKYRRETCGGVRLHVTDRTRLRALGSTLHIMNQVMESFPGRLEYYCDYFDKVMGTDRVRVEMEHRKPVEEILSGFRPGLEVFAQARKPYLLYE
jgi:uncharacterized protein YbbC (DUF1343 family)